MSVALPGVNATMTRSGLLGQACAAASKAEALAMPTKPSPRSQLRAIMVSSPVAAS
jgi:hypothetical protein